MVTISHVANKMLHLPPSRKITLISGSGRWQEIMIKNNIIKAGWLIKGDGSPVLKNMIITVRNGIFEKIEKAPPILPGEFSDFSTFTIIPHLIDSHAHLFMSGTTDQNIRQKQLRAKFSEIRPEMAKHVKMLMKNGVMGVRDGGDYGGYALCFKQKIKENLPIEIKAPGRAFRNTKRYGRLIGRAPDSGESLARAIKKNPEKPDHIKIVNSGLNSLTIFGKETSPQFSFDELKHGVETARKMGLKVMCHSNGKIPVKISALAGCASIEHGFFMGKENLKLIAEKNIFWVPTAITMKAYSMVESHMLKKDIAKRNYEHQMEQISMAKDLGVKIALGTDAGSMGVYHGISVAREISIFIKAGMGISEAIKCATKNGAELIGLKNKGVIKPGAEASFLAVKGNYKNLPENLESGKIKIFVKGCKKDL